MGIRQTERTRQTRQNGMRFGALLYSLGLFGLAVRGLRSPRRTDVRALPNTAMPPAAGVIATPRQDPRLSWGAILAGSFVALASLVTLGSAGLGIALWIYEPPSSLSLPERLPVGVILWGGAAAVASLSLGGWVAGRLAGAPGRLEGALHGFVVWAVVGVLTTYLAVSSTVRLTGEAIEGIASTVSFVERTLADVASVTVPLAGAGMAAAVVSAEPEIPLDAIRSEAQDLLRQAITRPGETLESLEEAIEGLESALMDAGGNAPTAARPGMPGPQVDPATAVSLIAQQTGAPPERAALGLREWTIPTGGLSSRVEGSLDALQRDAMAALKQVERRALRLIDRASSRLGWALGMGAAGLLGMAIVACLGGALGAVPLRMLAEGRRENQAR
jgi:hypothetical protein